MAVMQNNTEPQDVAPGTAGSASAAGSSAPAGQTTGTNNSNAPGTTHISDEGGGGVGGVIEPNGLDACSNASFQTRPQDASTARESTGVAISATERQFRDIHHLLTLIQKFSPENQKVFMIYRRIITILANIPPGTTPEELKCFKAEITKIGQLMAMNKDMMMLYLRTVYDLITQSAYESPSCAVAIVFQLFSPNLILEAVASLLNLNVQDESIRKTVALLCKWIKVCNFCQNLNLWIMALLKGLRDQEKYMLLDEIALDNIEALFRLMIFPIFRVRVAPIVFHMLSTINQTPEIFHKILGHIPYVINVMKQQAGASGDTRNYIQKLVDLTNALILRFYDNDDLYAPVKDVLQLYEPSQNSVALARALFENALPRNARVGLVNLGNTCYMNSVLQALAMTSDFVRQILVIESGSSLLLQMQQQLALMHHSMRYELTPSRVLKATRPPGFTPGLQQDSSEFLGYLLDLLHEHEINSGPHCLQHMDDADMPLTDQTHHVAESTLLTEEIMAAGVIPYNSNDHVHNTRPNVPAPPTPTSTPTNAQMPKKKQPSTIDKTFAGQLSTTYKCLDCGWESHNEDSFRELQLSFPDDKDECSATNYSVQDLIDYFCSPEKLDGDNQYFCARCKKLCDAERRIAITRAPRNLILTLKQFKYDQKYHFRTKLMHKVFHDERVVVKVCAVDTLQEAYIVHYDLYAGVVHAGYSMDSGHYFTFAADESKNWFKFNDSLVTNSKPHEMHSLTSPNTPYILFYQMCGRSTESPPNGPMQPIQLAQPLTLDELPRSLRDYVKQDNINYSEELKMQRFKRQAKRNNVAGNGTMTRNRYDGDDEDDHMPPPTGGCGGNDVGLNCNRFVC